MFKVFGLLTTLRMKSDNSAMAYTVRLSIHTFSQILVTKLSKQTWISRSKPPEKKRKLHHIICGIISGGLCVHPCRSCFEYSWNGLIGGFVLQRCFALLARGRCMEGSAMADFSYARHPEPGYNSR